MNFLSTNALIGLVKDKLIKLVEDNEETIDNVFRQNLGKLSPEDKTKFLNSWNKLDLAVKETLHTQGGKRTRRKARKQRKHRK